MLEPGKVMGFLWVAWVVSWLAAAFWSAPATKRAGVRTEITYRIPFLLGGILFLIPAHGYSGRFRFWQVTSTGAWICAAIILLGLAFTWWARIQLGRNWSAEISKKEEHQIIEKGPYAFVRHPIYTGLLLAILATLAAKGTLLGIMGAVLLTLGFWMKARFEEKFLERELDGVAYADYRRRVPMLIPWKWPGSAGTH